MPKFVKSFERLNEMLADPPSSTGASGWDGGGRRTRDRKLTANNRQVSQIDSRFNLPTEFIEEIEARTQLADTGLMSTDFKLTRGTPVKFEYNKHQPGGVSNGKPWPTRVVLFEYDRESRVIRQQTDNNRYSEYKYGSDHVINFVPTFEYQEDLTTGKWKTISFDKGVRKIRTGIAFDNYYKKKQAIARTKATNEMLDLVSVLANPNAKFGVVDLVNEDGSVDSTVNVEAKDIKSKKLIPTQNQLDPDKSIKYALTNPKATRNLFAHTPVLVKKPIVTFNSRYIMDGHHAWAEVVINRPDEEIGCVNLLGEASPLQMLNHVKRALSTVMTDSTGHGVSETLDLYLMSESDSRAYVSENLTEECESIYREFGITDPIEHVVKGIRRMQNRNRPITGAKQRDEMPQFGSSDQRTVGLNHINHSVIGKTFEDQGFSMPAENYQRSKPNIIDVKSWYSLIPTSLVNSEFANLNVELYGITFDKLFKDTKNGGLDELTKSYGIMLRSRRTASYHDGTLKTWVSLYFGPDDNVKWLRWMFEQMNKHYNGQHNRIQVATSVSPGFHGWTMEDWLDWMGLEPHVTELKHVKLFESMDSFKEPYPGTYDIVQLTRLIRERRKLIELGLAKYPLIIHHEDGRTAYVEDNGKKFTILYDELENETSFHRDKSTDKLFIVTRNKKGEIIWSNRADLKFKESNADQTI
jgi:hypothetical protein